MKTDVTHEGLKATPPLLVTGWAWLYGLTLEKWVAIATLAYIVLQALYLLWKWRKESKEK